MWKLQFINWVTNIFGGVAGMAQVVEGITLIQQDQLALGVAKFLEGAGLFVVGYFTGKSAISLKPQ